MATGDAAAAAGMDVLTGSELANTLDTEENKTRDYIAQFATLARPIANGGTGATTAASARSGLGMATAYTDVNEATPAGDTGAAAGNKLVRFNELGRIGVNTPVSAGQATNKGYVDAAIAALSARITALGG